MTVPNANPAAVAAFLDAVEPGTRQAEARLLVALFHEETGFVPQFWPGGIIGFGR